MDCILKVIRGPETGHAVKVGRGDTIVGKSSRAALQLASPDVSVEHVVITNTGEDFFVENLSAKGTFLNETKITGKTRLRLRDQIRVSPDTVLRLESEAGDSFIARHRPLFITFVAVLIALVAVLIIADPFAKPPPAENRNHAYSVFDAYIQRQIAAGKYPRSMGNLFQEAWRHQLAKDNATSRELWYKLHVQLATVETPDRLADSPNNRRALTQVLRSRADDPEPPVSDEALAAALARFVTYYEKEANKRYNQARSAFE